MRRVIDAYRLPKRERPKFDAELVVKIRKEWEERTTYKTLARKYGLTPRQVEYIINTLQRRARKSYNDKALERMANSLCRNKSQFHEEQTGDACTQGQS